MFNGFAVLLYLICRLFFFFFNDTATTEIYTLSLHDALPIFSPRAVSRRSSLSWLQPKRHRLRSEEHTSELQSRLHLVCRLLLEKKKTHKLEQALPIKKHNYANTDHMYTA